MLPANTVAYDRSPSLSRRWEYAIYLSLGRIGVLISVNLLGCLCPQHFLPADKTCGILNFFLLRKFKKTKNYTKSKINST